MNVRVVAALLRCLSQLLCAPLVEVLDFATVFGALHVAASLVILFGTVERNVCHFEFFNVHFLAAVLVTLVRWLV